ncbi:hypothetical protein BTUL_0022g00740 [Botrytis tulipae]|uniref:Uncharacterized protein n=1 Tax=Botrytis tulipae TaxID=87230 RepID=A0A4Z1F1N9_9HELO|nr:hypothetical protein BTUL_0022g00740 [Botrytis tulipae]
MRPMFDRQVDLPQYQLTLAEANYLKSITIKTNRTATGRSENKIKWNCKLDHEMGLIEIDGNRIEQ